jgi:pimeloyl-ACP methyl ester carboxylesterase
MSSAEERFVIVNGSRCRVLEKGTGKSLVVLSGYGGLPRWDAFHDLLARSRKVIAPSLPGQFGSDRGHEKLHNPLDWLAALQDLLQACGASAPVDLVALSVAGMLASELAAASAASLDKLVLVGSYGLYDPDQPTANLYAFAPDDRPSHLVKNTERYKAVFAPPADAGTSAEEEFAMLAYRSDEAMARLAWPFGDIGLSRRIHRISTPTLLVWGAEDRLVPPVYAETFARGMSGPSRIEIVAGAGHLATVDAPDELAALISGFVG